jgi:hypothetical protein
MGQTWTMDERIDARERAGDITPPFTERERALVWAVAEALYLFHYLTEPPGRAPERTTASLIIDMAIARVELERTWRGDHAQAP